MRYQIYEAKSVKYDAQQRVGINIQPAGPFSKEPAGFLLWLELWPGAGGERPQTAPAFS